MPNNDGDRNINVLIEELKIPERRDAAFKALKKMDDDRAIEPLLKLVSEDQDREAKSYAVELLGILLYRDSRPPDDVVVRVGITTPLTTYAREMRDKTSEEHSFGVRLRQAIDDALRNSGREPVFYSDSELINAIDHPNSAERERVQQRFKKMGKEAYQPLLGAVQSKPEAVLNVLQTVVRTTQGKTRGTPELGEVIEALTGMMQDKAFSHRGLAAKILADTRDPRAIKPITETFQNGDENMEMRLQCLEVLTVIQGKLGITALINALSDELPEVRTAAALSLGKIGGEEIIGPLENIFLDDNMDVEVRRAALRGLNNIKMDSIDLSDLLLLVIQDKDVQLRQMAANVMHRLKGDKINEALMIALNDENTGVRIAALRACERDRDGYFNAVLKKISKDENEEESIRKAALRAYQVS